MSWSQKKISEVIKQLQSHIQKGLSLQQVQERRKKFGANRLPEQPRESWLFVFIRQFKSPLIYVLLAAAAVLFFVVKDKVDALVVGGVLFFNAIIGTIQEGRAQTILESLKKFSKTTSVVLRDGKKQFVSTENIVVGDIVILQEGERIPADIRIFQSNGLRVDEALLTGESKSVDKTDQALQANMPIHEQKNMLFSGSYILSGSGVGIVVAVGAQTEIGKMHQVVQAIDTDMPLKKELARLSSWILWLVLGMCTFLFIIGFVTGKPFKELLTTLTALFICVIPEGLPVVLTLVLVSGVYKMARKYVLVKRMQGVEALGRADILIIDKTGTLTRNEMIISKVATIDKKFDVSGVGYFERGSITHNGKKINVDEEKILKTLGIACALLNSSEFNFVPDMNLFEIKGSPTEVSMAVFAAKLGLYKSTLEKEYKKIYEIPFSAQRGYHATFYKKDEQGFIFVSGAPERVLAKVVNGNKEIHKDLQVLLQEGLRVVAIATKSFDLATMPMQNEDSKDDSWFKDIISDLTFVGLSGIQDSIRPEVAQTIAQAQKAGVRIIMATGDHKKTALYVAQEVGLFKKGDQVLTGSEIDELSEDAFRQAVNKTSVFARVTPKQKLAIVTELKKQKNIVAMTGDGVNDVPSLVAADLGIAMGQIGTQAAKEAADIVLLDDSLVSIVGAIEYGRYIFYTLRRVVLYFFSTNTGELLLILFALLLGLPLPLLAVQILWLNLVTDGFLDVAISVEKKEKGLLQKTVRNNLFHLVDKNIIFKMFYMALPMAIFSLLIFYSYCHKNIVHARSMVLVTMAMFQWFNAFNCRSETKSIFELGLFSNRWLLLAMTVVLGLQVFVLHNAFMQRLFKTVPISLKEWGLVILVSSSIVVFEEIRKWFVFRKKKA
ncbi:HAD-IC family P-type ATPase [bacterium]|nr:HAD-IC family P-type ATPase [bacterium]